MSGHPGSAADAEGRDSGPAPDDDDGVGGDGGSSDDDGQPDDVGQTGTLGDRAEHADDDAVE
jgi:hypothetical protein